MLLAQAMRNHGGTVIFVHVQLGELLQMGGDAPITGKGTPPPPHASVLVPEPGVEATDLVVINRSWGAFYGTDLELHHFSTRKVFPAMGEVRATLQIIQALRPE